MMLGGAIIPGWPIPAPVPASMVQLCTLALRRVHFVMSTPADVIPQGRTSGAAALGWMLFKS